MIFPKAFVSDINTARNCASGLLKRFETLQVLKPKNASVECFVYKNTAYLGIRWEQYVYQHFWRENESSTFLSYIMFRSYPGFEDHFQLRISEISMNNGILIGTR